MNKKQTLKRIDELKGELKTLEDSLVECPCRSCGQEVDIFGAIIDEKYFCGACAGPVLDDWFGKNGRVEMSADLQKKVASELMKKRE